MAVARVEDRWYKRDKKTKTAMHGRGLRWQARWDEMDGTPKKKSFRTKDEADAHLAEVAHKKRTGTYVAGSAGEAFVEDLLTPWQAGQLHWKASTRAAVESDVRAHLRPHWGDWAVGSIRKRDVQDWVAGMNQAPRTVGTIHGRLMGFLEWCVEEQRIAKNPASGVKLPKGRKREHYFLTVDQVAALADTIEDRYSDLVWVLASAGLRIGEAAELRVRDLQLERGRIRIERSVVFVGGREAKIGPPKSGKARTVPVIPAVAERLAKRAKGRGWDELVFATARGAQVRANNFKRREFDRAVTAVNAAADKTLADTKVDGVRIPEGLWVHDLRHTAASWAVRSGASVKSVQRMLGHATAAITLDTYAGLFDEDLDDVAVRMGAMLGGVLGEKFPESSPGLDSAA
ncbi:tyrosine-type recombinase/integrase, partial [Arthrobacter ginkgonis]|uniref:tyrosine-type recombinase/integrase n=1 Tax=Arthrobacter ginkgonis TaxID=1630594 RepID=UPI0031EF28C9